MGDGCGDEKVWARGPYLSLFLQLQFNYCSSALQKDFVIFLSYGKEHKFCSWKMPLSIILNLLEMHNVLYSSPRIENVSLNFRIKELLSKKKTLKGRSKVLHFLSSLSVSLHQQHQSRTLHVAQGRQGALLQLLGMCRCALQPWFVHSVGTTGCNNRLQKGKLPAWGMLFKAYLSTVMQQR